MAVRAHVAGCAVVLVVGCVPFRSGRPRECPLPPNYIHMSPGDTVLAHGGVYRIITLNVARDRHHPDVISGQLRLTRPDTTQPFYWETDHGLERRPAPQLVGILVWDRAMRGYAKDSVIAGFGTNNGWSLRSGHCTTCWDPKFLHYNVFAVQSTGFTGWWYGPRTLRVNYDPGPTKEERKKMVPDPRGYFCATRIA
jgi:hypothetical protein